MFERFSKEARTVVVRSREIAAGEQGDVEARHLLLAMIEDQASAPARALMTVGVGPAALRAELGGDDLDDEALAALGIDAAVVRDRMTSTFGPDAFTRRRHGAKRTSFARDAKRMLELALREAMGLGDRELGSRHLLLAVLRLDGSPTQRALARALGSVGADAPTLRTVLAGHREAS